MKLKALIWSVAFAATGVIGDGELLAQAVSRLSSSSFAARSALQNAGTLRPRRLAPGVLTVIRPHREVSETFTSPAPLPGVLALDKAVLDWGGKERPNFSPNTWMLKNKVAATVMRRTAWNLEFAFKPLRMIKVDIPQPSGKMQRKIVWYMVYQVRNTSGHLKPKAQVRPDAEDSITYTTEPVAQTLRFFPQFQLVSHEFGDSYLDQITPVAIPAIQRRESPGSKLHNSVEISQLKIKPSTADEDNVVWGVVTWQDINPDIDFFSIFVKGLSNAYRWEESKQAEPSQASPRRLAKTLQLNFWRPGDNLFENESEIRYGMPVLATSPQPGVSAQQREQVLRQRDRILKTYGLNEPLDYLWVYR